LLRGGHEARMERLGSLRNEQKRSREVMHLQAFVWDII
jgi:hypothetical protein